jgi:hypothetical protein
MCHPALGRHPLPCLSRISNGNDRRLPRERREPFVVAAVQRRHDAAQIPAIYLRVDESRLRFIQRRCEQHRDISSGWFNP